MSHDAVHAAYEERHLSLLLNTTRQEERGGEHAAAHYSVLQCLAACRSSRNWCILAHQNVCDTAHLNLEQEQTQAFAVA